MRKTGRLEHRSLVMPNNLNPLGTLFGGELLSHFDLAGANIAVAESGKIVVLAVMDNAKFYAPTYAGNVISVYGEIAKIGNTSITVSMQAWNLNRETKEETLCAEATATYVCVNKDLKPVSAKG